MKKVVLMSLVAMAFVGCKEANYKTSFLVENCNELWDPERGAFYLCETERLEEETLKKYKVILKFDSEIEATNIETESYQIE